MTDLLIIDDDTDLCYLITQILEPYQLNISSTPSLTEAEQYIRGTKVRTVLLDHHVADGAALDFIATIHQIDQTINVLVTSNSMSRVFEQQALAKGATLFLPKPFNYQQVLELGLLAGDKKKTSEEAESYSS